ncbi:MAG TPA: EFR1 family ferrodoxin [Clostridia bacterium]|nr:EFR1 family ferrodoxin [Clostridia bacterium]
MIFYFSGTGNSYYVASQIASSTGEGLAPIARLMRNAGGGYEYTLQDGEAVGFVYPIYAWAPPRIVLDFISKLKLKNYKNNYIFSAATCGDDTGNSVKLLRSSLKKRGLNLDACFSVKMPNNYVFMMDVDPENLKKEKLAAADKAIDSICDAIKEKRTVAVDPLSVGLPGLKTALVTPLFNNFGIHPRRFFTEDSCTGCGICEKVCPYQNIRLNGRPVWGNHCGQCFACLHYCPVKAVQYGRGTRKKGRYTNPNVKISDMFNDR